MNIDEFIEEKIELETKKIKAFKELWENEIKPALAETNEFTEEELNQNDFAFEDWNEQFYSFTNAFGSYFFDGEKFVKVPF